jgi:uncharacterized tellurite resistance protein B-like protein
MINFLKDILNHKCEDAETPAINEDKIAITKLQIATCALFLEIAHADDEFLDIEKDKIISVMKKLFDLSNESVENLLELSEEKRTRSISLYEYTDIINNSFTQAEKYQVLKNLWQLILIDEKLDAYEAHFIRKISGNLKMNHSDMISAKMEVKAELEEKSN